MLIPDEKIPLREFLPTKDNHELPTVQSKNNYCLQLWLRRFVVENTTVAAKNFQILQLFPISEYTTHSAFGA